jgi:hypothetical protein
VGLIVTSNKKLVPAILESPGRQINMESRKVRKHSSLLPPTSEYDSPKIVLVDLADVRLMSSQQCVPSKLQKR